MRTHRFVGATSREVLNKVKQALGDDALILSNRAHDGGIEVVALSAADANGAIDEPSAALRSRRAAPAAEAPLPAVEPAAVQAPIAAEPVTPSPYAFAALTQAAVAPAELVARVAPPAAAATIPAPAPLAVAAMSAAVMAPVAAVHAVAATSAIRTPIFASAIDAIPALANAAITRSTASPSMMAPPVITRPAAQPISTPAAMMQPAPAPVAASIAAPAPVSAHAPAPEPASAAIDYASAAAVLFAGSPVSWQPSPARVSPQSARTVEAAPTAPRNVTPAVQRDIRAVRPVDTSISGVAKAGVMHELLSAGFSAHLARQVADEVCADDPDPTIEAVAESLERELWIAGADEIITRGGIYALVGPTGVGKTTTVAKLAARAVVRFGASKVALLTTDSYRVGAHDQLRIYGRILSVPVHAIRDARDLATALAEQKDRHIVLIDTIGMSQRDRMVAEQAAMLAGCGDVKRLLLLPTTANARTLEQVVSAYKKSGVDGCILTKTDEAGSIAPALDVIIRHQLPLHYVTDGQRVPEDLQLPDSVELVREALKSSDDEAFVLSQDEMPFMIPVDHARSTEEVAHG